MKRKLTYEMFKQLPSFINISHFGTKQKLMFDTTDIDEEDIYSLYFNKDNWNSGQNIIRYIGLNMYDEGLNNYKFYNKEKEEIVITIIKDEEEWSCHINYYNDKKVLEKTIIESWYKSRGRTTQTSINNRSINLEEYLEIINDLIQDDKVFKWSGLDAKFNFK